jgi:Methyltransferase domain
MDSLRGFFARAFRKATFLLEPPAPPIIDISNEDEYINWLCFANAGMLTAGNLHLIDTAMKRLRSAAPVLEIGSFCGLSANVLTHYKRKYGLKNRLVTCDKWEFENAGKSDERIGSSPIHFSDYRTFVRASYLRNARAFSADDLPFTLEATSSELFAAWREKKETEDVFGRPITLGGPISFCYVDGDHSYEGAKQDFLNCDAFLEEGGFILFDDSTVERFGVRQLMPEIVASGRYNLAARNPNHLFQKLRHLESRNAPKIGLAAL